MVAITGTYYYRGQSTTKPLVLTLWFTEHVKERLIRHSLADSSALSSFA